MVKMSNTFLFVTDFHDIASIDKNELKKSKVFSFNIESHKYLKKKKIDHKIAENYLSENERIKIFDHIVNLHNWYEKRKELKEFEFEGTNLLGLLDTVEFHTYLMNETINFFTIKKIIETEKPDSIIAPTNFSEILKPLIKNDVKLKFYSNPNNKKLQWDEITIKQNIGKLPISFNISRKTYSKIKTIWEKTICSIFNLWFDLKNSNQKTILFLEFYPPLYDKLLSNLKKSGFNIIFLNRRKPAVYDFKSIKLLQRVNGKIINFDELLNSSQKNQIKSISDDYFNKLQIILSKDDIFENIFSIDEFSIWKSVKKKLIETYQNRINDYVFLLFFSKILIEKINVSCILTLNEIGETEKSILTSNRKKIPTILLEHGFSNFFSESARFGILANYSNFNDKIAVWSNKQKIFLTDFFKINSNRILVTGSPRHDYLFKHTNVKKNSKKKTVLITPTPITQIQGFDITDIHLKYELTLKRILNTLKILDCNIILKIHPSQNIHNDMIKQLVFKIDKKIPIHLLSPINELIQNSDMIITITPESWAPSTVILESLIQNRPIINVTLDEHSYEFDFIKSKSIISVSSKSDIERIISDLVVDKKLQANLVKNGQEFIKNFLYNPGLASDTLVEKIKLIEESNNNTEQN